MSRADMVEAYLKALELGCSIGTNTYVLDTGQVQLDVVAYSDDDSIVIFTIDGGHITQHDCYMVATYKYECLQEYVEQGMEARLTAMEA